VRSSAVKSLISLGRYGQKRPFVVFTRWKSKVQSLQRPQSQAVDGGGIAEILAAFFLAKGRCAVWCSRPRRL
jgi:hypothetical protein